MAYDYKREVAENNWSSMTRSRSRVNTFYGQAEGEYNPRPQREHSPINGGHPYIQLFCFRQELRSCHALHCRLPWNLPSHTQVTWNGMRINNPMLGMTDFSTIPSYFIDQASLLHGTSSVNETGGGLGGLVRLGTIPDVAEGVNLQYVQGVGSFSTFDEFARFTYGSEHWHVSSRVVYSSSPNDYKYINHDKKVNIYDDDKNIIGQYHPTERNRSGAYKDFHALQEVYYNTNKGDRFGFNAWYINSNRELPMLTTDYGNERNFENRQREQTLRSVLSWDHRRDGWKFAAKGGYIHTWMAYDYKREVAENNWSSMTRSRSRVNTFYGQAEGEYNPTRKWYFTANISAHQHFVRSEDKNIILQDGDKAVVGYDKGRIELSGSASAKWQPADPLGLSLVLRQEMFGDKWAPLSRLSSSTVFCQGKETSC